MSSYSANLDFYTEKIHIMEKDVMREIIIFIHRGKMSFMFLEKAISFISPIDICHDIDEILYCDMKYVYNPQYQFMAIKLNNENVNNSHIFII